MAGAEVDLDPGAVRAVAAGLTALVPEIRELCGHVEPAAAAAAHFGAPDRAGLLAAELAARCDEVHSTLSRLGRLAATLAGELRAGADLVATADEHSARTIRSAEGQGG